MQRTPRIKPRLLTSLDSEDSSFTESEGIRRKTKIKKRKSGNWNESSLSVLTAKFLELLKNSHDGSVDLNMAVKVLEV